MIKQISKEAVNSYFKAIKIVLFKNENKRMQTFVSRFDITHWNLNISWRKPNGDINRVCTLLIIITGTYSSYTLNSIKSLLECDVENIYALTKNKKQAPLVHMR